MMRAIEDVWPLFQLRLLCGPLEMRALRDDDFPAMLEVIEGGIHDPDEMPFYFPWTDAKDDELRINTMQYHWRSRAEFTQDKWSLELGVWRDGQFVGAQGVSTTDFLVTRTGETGSWLGRKFHGEGTGTLMRQVICTLCFDHLDFAEITSGAFVDNPASLAVSRKVGYVQNGMTRLKRRDAMAANQGLVLTPEAFVRPGFAVEAEGVDAVRRLIGLAD